MVVRYVDQRIEMILGVIVVAAEANDKLLVTRLIVLVGASTDHDGGSGRRFAVSLPIKVARREDSLGRMACLARTLSLLVG